MREGDSARRTLAADAVVLTTGGFQANPEMRARYFGPGTVDAGYRGEVKVMLINLDPKAPVRLRRGDRIAQLVIQQVERARFVEVDRLPGSARGAGGYGSTGGFVGPDGHHQETPIEEKQ